MGAAEAAGDSVDGCGDKIGDEDSGDTIGVSDMCGCDGEAKIDSVSDSVMMIVMVLVIVRLLWVLVRLLVIVVMVRPDIW